MSFFFIDDVRVLAFIGLGALAILLALAVWHDVREYRVPNAVVFFGTGLALALNAMLPRGEGFTSQMPGGVGLLASCEGFCIGLAALLPFYCLRAAGAGDVKLMAMVGAFLGPMDAVGSVVCTFIAGGAMAVVWLMSGTVAVHSPRGAHGAVCEPGVGARRWRTKLPYSLAIAVGSTGWVAFRLAG